MHGVSNKIKRFSAFGTLLCLMGCGSSVKVGKQIFNIHIFGTSVAPDGATGNKDPIWQKYTLTGVSFLNTDSTDATVLYDGLKAAETTVVDRPQIIYSKDIGTYNAKSFAGITASFTPTVTGAHDKKVDYTFTLPSPTMQISQAFKVETGKGLDLTITINWKNTVSGDTMEPPNYDLSISQ